MDHQSRRAKDIKTDNAFFSFYLVTIQSFFWFFVHLVSVKKTPETETKKKLRFLLLAGKISHNVLSTLYFLCNLHHIVYCSEDNKY